MSFRSRIRAGDGPQFLTLHSTAPAAKDGGDPIFGYLRITGRSGSMLDQKMKIHFTSEQKEALSKIDASGKLFEMLVDREIRNQVYDWNHVDDYKLTPIEMRVIAIAEKWKSDLVNISNEIDENDDMERLQHEARAIGLCLLDLYGNFQDIIR